MEKKLKVFKIVTIVLSIVAVIAITTLSVILIDVNRDRAVIGNDLENMYQRAYYELIANINSIEIGFSKLMVTSYKPCQIEQLNEISKNSHLAGVALSTLSAENIAVIYTSRYINQTGDFATYLVNELSRGKDITDEDYEILERLYEMTRKIGAEMSQINDEIAKGDYIFTERLKMSDDIFSKVFLTLEENIVEYPALIYDGPFSAALVEKEVKGLIGNDITPDEGVQVVLSLMSDYGIKDVKYTGETNNHFQIYNYEALTKENDNVSIEITQKGGHLLLLNISRAVDEPNFSPEECAELAEQYIADLGYENMKSVWVSNYNSVIYVNLAPIINDVVYYPDLIKVKIASNNGDLIGVEAQSYLYNHTERQMSSVNVTETQARAALSARIVVETVRLTLIPYKKGTEILAYEFSGRAGESMYYIYVDANTGEEIKILRVIDSDEGSLLM